MYRCATSWGDPGIVSRRKYARGKALKVAKPAFPPRAPPFRARSCCMLWKCEYVLVGRWILRCWQCNVTPIYTQVESAAPRPNISRQTTGKLSLSSRSSSAATPRAAILSAICFMVRSEKKAGRTPRNAARMSPYRVSLSTRSSSVAHCSSLMYCATEKAACCSASFFESPEPCPTSMSSTSTVQRNTGCADE
mgnify:CR=1 FL=1